MDSTDKRHKLDEDPFSYHATKDGRVLLSWHGKQVMILKGMAAQKFLQNVAHASNHDAQLLMAKITGNFKRGNEH